jgi:hypothetical protein
MNRATVVGLKLNSPAIRRIAALSADESDESDESKEIETKHQTSQRHHRITGGLFCAKDLHWIDLCRTPCRNRRSTRTDEQEDERRRADGEWVEGLHSKQEGSNGQTACPAGNDAAPPRTRSKATIAAACRVTSRVAPALDEPSAMRIPISRRCWDLSGTESAGINRHIVGDEKALRKRRSDSMLASSLACDFVRDHSEA